MHNQLKILNYIASTERFKAIFAMTVILSLYGSIVLGVSTDNFIDSIFIPFQFPIFNVFMFSLLLLNTLNTCSIINKNFSFYILRLQNKKKYCIELLKSVILVNLFLLCLFFLFFFIVLNIFKLGKIQIHNYQNYNVTNLIYVIFYLFRYIFIAIGLTMFSALLFLNFKWKITLVIDGIFLAMFLLIPIDMEIKNHFSLSIWSYFTNTMYSTFLTEISFSLLFLCILEGFVLLLFHFTYRNKRMVIS